MSKTIEEAKRFLRGEAAEASHLFDLGQKLKDEQKFDLARRIFARAAAQPNVDDRLRYRLVQQQASSTEKDPDLPLDRRFEEARAIIAPILDRAEEFFARPLGERATASDDLIGRHQETFGIAGAIEKRCWQADPQPKHLRRALELYRKGYRLRTEPERSSIPDHGYTGINAAFVLDLLANQDGAENIDGIAAARDRDRAREIREEIARKLEALPESERSDWWTVTTLAEAYLGLRDYKGAEPWLAAAAALKPGRQPWEYETAVKQFARLALLQSSGDTPVKAEGEKSEAWRALEILVGEDEAGLTSAFRGKVGLALSGGGFRASLFHLGVLARLAELDMLRQIEVLSCVSGGSIIGALYYLKLRTLLQTKADSEITREDYLSLVQEMERQFMDAIVSNPRMQVFSRIAKFSSRTERMGELLDRSLYGPAAGLAQGERPRLRDLLVRPKNKMDFQPKYENWRRRNKIPILVLNATTLNTGHNWQFTATFMGESPNTSDSEVDGNERLRRMYFADETPPPHDAIPLGLAVAASAAVPGLFSPVKLSGLYPEREVELVDGGVHDNQGINSLREQDCTVLLVSDASGQLTTETHPARHPFAVLSRSNNTLMSRVRELEHKELRARKRAGLLREFMFVHLKKDLTVEPVDWIDCDLKKEDKPLGGASPESDDLTRYGVRGRVQNLLSGIRTDLDAFSEAEAFALMLSGYKMTSWDFRQCIENFETEAPTDPRWRFLAVENYFHQSGGARGFDAALQRAESLLFKGARLLPGAVLFARLARFGFWIAGLAFVAGLLAIFGWLIGHVSWLVALAILAFGVLCVLVVATLYPITRWLDRLYLKSGSLQGIVDSEHRKN